MDASIFRFIRNTLSKYVLVDDVIFWGRATDEYHKSLATTNPNDSKYPGWAFKVHFTH